MKIEINLNDVFEDEEGNEVQVSIKQQILENVTDRLFTTVSKQLELQLNKVLNEKLTAAVDAKLAEILPGLLDHEFTEVSSWGEKKGTYTVKSRMLAHIDKEFTYKNTGSSYDKNMLTKTVDQIIETRLIAFKSEYDKIIDRDLVAKALDYAQTSLQKKLGVKV